jgi:hypothetical protein
MRLAESVEPFDVAADASAGTRQELHWAPRPSEGNRDYRAAAVFCRAGAGRTQSGPIGPDRTSPRSDWGWYQVFVSMLFFFAKWVDRTDRTGITAGCSVRTAASCISSREPRIFRMSYTGRQRHSMQLRIAIPALHSLNNFKDRIERLRKPHRSIAPTIARKLPGRARVLRRYRMRNRSGWSARGASPSPPRSARSSARSCVTGWCRAPRCR